MNVKPEPSTLRRADGAPAAAKVAGGQNRRIARTLGLLVVAVAVCVLLGWVLEDEPLKTFWLGGARIKPGTAEALAACGLSLFLATLSIRLCPLQAGLGLAVSLFGGLFLFEYASGCDLGIDALFTGIGIPLAKQAKIFEEFRQLDNPGRDASKGLGPGLAIVSRLASLFGAEAEVRSRAGRGARFSLLPPQAQAAPVALETAPAVDNRGGRILVIEDVAVLRIAC